MSDQQKTCELKPHIPLFWESGAVQAQLIKDEKGDMTTGWNGHFDNAAQYGANVGCTFHQALLDHNCIAMPRGAPNKETAMRFLAEVSMAEYQVNLPFHTTYGPSNRKAYEMMTAPEDLIKALPSHPDNVPPMVPVSLDWCAEHRAEALEMYIEMLSE